MPHLQDNQRQGLTPGILPVPRRLEPSEQMTEKPGLHKEGRWKLNRNTILPLEKVTAQPHMERGAGPSMSRRRAESLPCLWKNPSGSLTAQFKFHLL